MKRLAGKPIVVQVLRVKKAENDVTTSTLANVLVPPAYHATLGLKMKMGEVAAVRDRSPASDKVQPGDVITAATVTAERSQAGGDTGGRSRPGAPAVRAGRSGRQGAGQGRRSSRPDGQALGRPRTEGYAA